MKKGQWFGSWVQVRTNVTSFGSLDQNCSDILRAVLNAIYIVGESAVLELERKEAFKTSQLLFYTFTTLINYVTFCIIAFCNKPAQPLMQGYISIMVDTILKQVKAQYSNYSKHNYFVHRVQKLLINDSYYKFVNIIIYWFTSYEISHSLEKDYFIAKE